MKLVVGAAFVVVLVTTSAAFSPPENHVLVRGYVVDSRWTKVLKIPITKELTVSRLIDLAGGLGGCSCDPERTLTQRRALSKMRIVRSVDGKKVTFEIRPKDYKKSTFRFQHGDSVTVDHIPL